MKSKPDKSTCIFGAGVIYRHLKSLNQEINGVRQAEDIEHIHRMRVATRRLRATLPLFENCYPAKKVTTWQTEIKRVTRALGSARDTDVQIDRIGQMAHEITEINAKPGIRRLLLRLKQKREQQQKKVVGALNKLEDSGIVEEMQTIINPLAKAAEENYPYSDQLYRLAYDNIHRCLGAMLAYSEFVPQPERIDELHAMRIEAKRLRYTLESFAPLFPDQFQGIINIVRSIQELLGDIHDCDVWVQFLPQFIEEERQRTIEFCGRDRPLRFLVPGIIYLKENRQSMRDQIYTRFALQWQAWLQQNTWEQLNDIIQLPLTLYENVIPPLAEREPDETTPDEAAEDKETGLWKSP